MLNALERTMGAWPSPSALPRRAQPQEQGSRLVTTVTTHCDQDHWHTPACPHSVYTRTVDEAQRQGEHIDLYA